MQIAQYKISDLIPYVNNTRTHSDKQVSQIASSIKEFGFTNPVLVDAQGGIIAGHGRVMAAQKLKMDEVPCIVLAHLTEAQKKAYIIADNKLALNAGWDEELLKLELESLKELDFDIDVIGFSGEELDELFKDNTPQEVVEDEAPEPPENPISKRGDIWLLGRHRLMCGDSTSEDVDVLMDGKKANMCFTDPPYLMNFTGTINNDGSKSHNGVHGAIKNDKMSKEDGQKFIDSIVSKIKETVIGAYYICFYRLGMHYVFNALQNNDLEYKAIIVWDKPGGTLSNSDYKSRYEPIFYGWVKEHKYYGGKDGWDIWTINKTRKNDLHPTMKPLELCAKAISNSSEQNGFVLDLFGGSGSTLIASEQLNRICYMMELDEKYVDVIMQRYVNFKESDEDVYLIRDGQRYTYQQVLEMQMGD
jgi:DNA modification methylase